MYESHCLNLPCLQLPPRLNFNCACHCIQTVAPAKQVQPDVREDILLDLKQVSLNRSGRKYEVEEEDENGVVTGVSIRQQLIVRFTSWKSRTSVYRNRKKSKSLRYKIDLTKRRVNLLAKARQSTKHMDGIDYIFADINCRLDVKFNDGKFNFFQLRNRTGQHYF